MQDFTKMLCSASSCYIDGVEFAHALPSAQLADALTLIKSSRAAVELHVTALRKAIQSGDLKEQLTTRGWLTSSPEVILVSAVAANKTLRCPRRASLEWCLGCSDKLDFSGPLPEVVPVRLLAKFGGGWRAIHNPGPLHRTAQDVVLRVLGTYLRPRPFQFTQVGVHQAIEKVKAAIADEHTHVGRLDIKEFYASFDPDQLAHELPLPKEVVEQAVVGRHMKVKVDQGSGGTSPYISPHIGDLLSLARLGIPTGSRSSPIVGMITLSHLAWLHTYGVVIVNYADDFLVLARSALLRDEAVKALTSAVGEIPGGHFDLKVKSFGDIADGTEFLGPGLITSN